MYRVPVLFDVSPEHAANFGVRGKRDRSSVHVLNGYFIRKLKVQEIVGEGRRLHFTHRQQAGLFAVNRCGIHILILHCFVGRLAVFADCNLEDC